MEMEYNNENVNIMERTDGTFSAFITLSNQPGKIALIERGNDHWKITDMTSDSKTICLYDDKTISYFQKTAIGKDEIKLEQKFDPNMLDNNNFDNSLKEIYQFATAYLSQKMNVLLPLETIVKMRKQNLTTVLNALGFSSPTHVLAMSQNCGGFFDLRRIGETLENYQNLAFVRESKTKYGEQIYGFSNFPKLDGLEIAGNNINEKLKKLAEIIKGQLNFTQEQDELIRRNKAISVTFFSNINEKLNPNEASSYMKEVQKIGLLYLALNRDLLSPEIATRTPDFTGLQGKRLEDKISYIIDSPDYEKACKIEDKFVQASRQDIIGRIGVMLSDAGERIEEGSVGDELRDLIEQNEKDLKRRENNQQTMNDIYSNSNKTMKRPEGEYPNL